MAPSTTEVGKLCVCLTRSGVCDSARRFILTEIQKILQHLDHHATPLAVCLGLLIFPIDANATLPSALRLAHLPSA